MIRDCFWLREGQFARLRPLSSDEMCFAHDPVCKFDEPIALKDSRTIATMADARDVMQSHPERHRRDEHWLYAGGLLHKAATPNGSMKITAA